jgi:hypothetical protein
MSILVAAPTSDKKDYCLDVYTRQILSFTHPNYDIFIVDNSEDPNHIDRFWDLGLDAERVEPKGSPVEFITESQNIIREKVLMDGYEWLFMLETDVFVPLNILEYLVMYSNPVHTFSYFISNEGSALCLQGITTQVENKRGMRLDPYTGDSLFKGEIKPISEYKVGMDFDVYATGVGCTFIHRDVLQEVEFRVDKESPGIFSDSYFFMDLKRLGISPVLDTTIIPAHYRSDSFITDLRMYQ